ncbi:MAG: galactose oxidase-like domain-containing protein, partial [Phycisphaerae bacterium]
GFPGIEPVSSLDGSPGSSAASVYLEWDFNNGQGAGQGLAAVLTTGSGDGLNADFSAAARIGAWVRASTAQTAVRMWIYDAETDTGFFTPCQFLTGVDTWEEVSWLIPWPPEFDRTDVDGVAIVVDGIDAPGVQTGSARFDQITLYASTTPEPPSAVGRWLPPQPWPVTAIHSALLPTGKVLQYSYPTSDPGSRAMLFDPDTGLFDNVTMNTNIFCSGQSLLADGRLFVTGGNDVGCAESPRGIKDTHIFDPVSMTWTKLGDMSVGRWYPTNVLLGDGRLLLLSGIDHNCESTPVVERFTPGGGIEVMAGAARFLPLYPLMHLLTSGKVAQVGPNPDAYTFDPMAGTWEFVAVSSTGWRGSGTSVLVPGETDAVMIIGGAQNGAVTASCERIDFSDPVPQWRPTGSLTTARAHANAVILPDRTVLVVGGGEEGLYCSPISVPELYDPATETWTPLPPQVYGRMYHSTAVLLPDGRVLSAGQDADASGSWGEIYEPAYLFRGPRPVITTAPVQITYGDAFTVATPAAANITSVALIRPSAVTHSVNMDQRYVGLSFSLGNSGALLVTAPSDGNRAPPGYYMLFLVDAQGVPSVAKMVRLATSCPVSFSPRLPLGAVPATRYLSFEGANAGQQTAVRVTLGALPAPYDAFSGRTMWVGQPQPFCENGGINAPPVGGCGPGQSPSWGSTLQCTPFFTDWSTFGTVYVFHANLVPNGRYELQAVNELCGTGDESLFSRPLGLINSRWGDLVGAFDSASNSWTAPDGLVEVVSDVIAIIDKFAGRATAPIKARTDLEPATPDRLINISDATVALDAFRGRPYPFAPGPLPCP